VVGYAALLPFQIELGGDLKFAPADLCLVLAVLLAPGSLKYRKTVWSVWHYALLVVFGISTMVVALNAGTLNQYVILNKDAGLLVLFLAYGVITSAMTSWVRVRRVIRAFVIAVVLQNLVGIAAFLAANLYGIQSILIYAGTARLRGMMIDPNAYGGLLVFALVLCEGACYGPAPLFKPLFLFITRVSLGLGLLFSFSRSAWTGLALAFVLLFVLRFRTAIRAIGVAALAGVGLAVVLGNRLLPLIKAMAMRPEAGGGRFELVEDAIVEFGRHPFFGGGIGNFSDLEGQMVHNSSVWFLTDFGLVGFTVFACFVGWFFLRSYHAYRLAPPAEKPIVLGIILALVAMAGLSMGIEAFYQRHWWLAFALAASTYSLSRQKTPLGLRILQRSH
jgi:putative inorganic carbon (hco3(-)) transporter